MRKAMPDKNFLIEKYIQCEISSTLNSEFITSVTLMEKGECNRVGYFGN